MMRQRRLEERSDQELVMGCVRSIITIRTPCQLPVGLEFSRLFGNCCSHQRCHATCILHGGLRLEEVDNGERYR